MKKSQWKLVYIHPSFFKRRFYRRNYLILSSFRNSTIPFTFVGYKTQIYNGAWKMSRLIEDRMKGCKIGELAITKKFDRQGKAKRKTKRKTKKR